MQKKYRNHRLLKFKLDKFDYKKINNDAYFERKKNILLLNYFWNISKNIIKIIMYTKKKSKANWFKVLEELNLIEIIKDHFNLTVVEKNELWKLVSNNRCKICNKLIIEKNQFCSNTCSNIFKLKNESFKEKHRNSILLYHNTATKEEKEQRNKKIKESVKNFNLLLSKQKKREKYTNKKIIYTSYDNLTFRFPDLYFLFGRDEYYSSKRNLPVKCKKCGTEWEITKSTTLNKTICRKCNPFKKHKTQSKIYNYINSIIPAKENVKNIISNEIDIFVKELNFGIEFDGLLPHSYGFSKISYYNNFSINRNYHLRKTEECEQKGYQLFHIFENEFLNEQTKQIWESVLNSKLGNVERIFARKTQVKEISNLIYRDFCNSNHLQQNGVASIRIGLFYNEELVSVMSFGKSRYNKSIEYELIRFCSKLNTQIIGGASKLLRYFERTYSPKSIISYANRRWSQGNLYEKLGFEFVKNTAPNYFYFKPNENILYSRVRFQKHKLKDKLEQFDPNLTETENMFNNGYRKIFDCGNKVYIKKYCLQNR